MINHERTDNNYQTICMDGIRLIFQDFTTFPQNFEKLNYYYYLIFQQIVEAWESTNTLKEIEKNIKEKKLPDFRENLILWRDRIPHVCEGFHSLKSILDPRLYLFNYIQTLTSKFYTEYPQSARDAALPNISDHLWNYMIFIKYARKLKLYDVYEEYNDKFNALKSSELNYPFEFYMKNMENFKFIRRVSHTYEQGFEMINSLFNNHLDTEVKASYKGTQAYFKFKMKKYNEAQVLFKDAINFNGTDYKIWMDWAELNESLLVIDMEKNNINYTRFNETLICYFMTIVFKLDKAKFIIPKILYLIKKFNTFELQEVLKNYIDNIPTWVWVFWIPQILKLLKNPNQEMIAFYILNKIAIAYPQYLYYQLNIIIKGNEYSKYYIIS